MIIDLKMVFTSTSLCEISRFFPFTNDSDGQAAVSLAENLGVPIRVLYSKPGKPCIVSFAREDLGVACEFVIAAAVELNSTQSSSVETRWSNARSRQTSARTTEEPMAVDNQDGVGWGSERGMSPARTAQPREEEEDLYQAQMHLDEEEEEEEEVPPTQQERYQGIFDI
jgi:hypothetical protein